MKPKKLASLAVAPSHGCCATMLAFAALAFGCSDSNPPPAEGASYLSVTQCSGIMRVAWWIPTNGSKTTPAAVGSMAVDGKGATIKCAVVSAGGGYSVSGELDSDGVIFTVHPVL